MPKFTVQIEIEVKDSNVATYRAETLRLISKNFPDDVMANIGRKLRNEPKKFLNFLTNPFVKSYLR